MKDKQGSCSLLYGRREAMTHLAKEMVLCLHTGSVTYHSCYLFQIISHSKPCKVKIVMISCRA